MKLMDRGLVVEVARSWLGTPYRHQCALKGSGTDCLGLLRGVWSELYGRPAEEPPPYNPYWFQKAGRELMLLKAEQYLVKADYPATEFLPGDVLFFRMREGVAVKHCGIACEEGRMIHALSGKCVEEVTVAGSYLPRAVACYSFPAQMKGV